MENVLKVEGLVKRYGDFALDGVSLRVPAGCVTGFIGGNGAGKTTTIKSVLGIVMPDGGSVELFGEPVDARRDAELARAKARIGVVFDTCPFPSEVRVADVAKIGSGAYATWDGLMFAQLARDFGLGMKKQVKSLSRGMGMKLQLAFALSHKPDLLILDEVTAGLDPIARGEVLDILRAFMCDEAVGARRGILMSSHITSDLERIADFVVCIDAGREVFSCETADITDAAGIAHVRSADCERIAESSVFERGSLRVLRGDYATTLLVPDRLALKRAFPDIACERATIDDYMMFMMKGEIR